MPTCRFVLELAAQALEMVQLDAIPMRNADIEVLLGLREKCGEFRDELFLAFLDGFLPDELVLVGKGFNLSAVDKYVVHGNGTDFPKEYSHLREDFLDAWAQVLRDESRDGRMIRGGLSFQ